MQRHNSDLDDNEKTAVSGDVVHGHKVGGDQFNIGNMNNVQGVAVGDGASVTTINHYHNAQPLPQEKPKLSIEPAMVLIPAGIFVMGSDQHEPEEAPLHTAELPAFYIGTYPITNQEYAEFVWDTGRVVESVLLWNGNSPPDDKLQHPVTGVTWYEALAYCEWLTERSGRQYALPSEAQWEKAARGGNGRLYPWGGDWDPSRCNADQDTLTPVDAFPMQSEYGCFDMVGNGREWTATIWGKSVMRPDKISTYPWQNDRRNTINEPSTTRRIFRGGSASTPLDFRCTIRRSYLPEKSGPKRNRHGFRVARLLPDNPE
jgi:formylglycine-generating enzyme required for sulfatase activity